MTAPTQYAPVPPAPVKKSSGLGIAALVLGIVAVIFSIVPFFNVVGIVVGIVGLVLGFVGIFVSQRAMSVVGTILAAGGIVLAIAINNAVADAVDNNLHAPQNLPAQNETGAATTDVYVYTVAGTTSGDVSFSATNGSGESTSTVHVNGPWKKTFKAPSDEFFIPSLSIMNNADSGTIACRIVKNGKTIARNEASGQFATAFCNG